MNKSFNFNVASVMTGILFIFLSSNPAIATPYYRVTTATFDHTGILFSEGAGGASMGRYVDGSADTKTSTVITASATDTTIGFNGVADTGDIIFTGGFTSGQIGFDDIIFTDTSNPSSTGFIDVSVNLYSSLSSSSDLTDFYGSVGLVAGSSSSSTASNLFNGVLTGGSITTSTISVALNTTYSLVYYAALEFGEFPGGVDSPVGYATAGLSLARLDTFNISTANPAAGSNQVAPFNLPAGFTVNSAQAGIVDNVISTVPVPSAVYLLITGLTGLVGMARRNGKRAGDK